ncbi:hypothetical protein RRF57_000532 [Xylaria bambusicola]|uniref:Uncharacterized protein n=1 Tax=Xylaria bambusicola TaxID=326684 RepID=A0AAN7Z5M1_9PEZI
MSTYTPDGFVALLSQPLVPKHLGIIVVDFEGAMVHVASLIGAHEERMMVDIIIAAVNVGEDGNIFLSPVKFVDIQEVGWYKVKVFEVEIEFSRKILDTQTVMTQLQNRFGQLRFDL